MIDPGFEILNQRGTPMFFSDVFANRPTAGVTGRIFISTDTYAFYRDTGSTWDLIGGPGTGTITGTIADNQIAVGDGANSITGSSDLYFDRVALRMGIRSSLPLYTLDVNGNAGFTDNVIISNNANALVRFAVSNLSATVLARAGILLNANSGNLTLGKNSTVGSSYNTISSNDAYIENTSFGDITLQNNVATGRLKFSTGAASTSQMTLFSTGNLGIGVGLTDDGTRLQVSGNAILSSTTTLTKQSINSTQDTWIEFNKSNTNKWRIGNVTAGALVDYLQIYDFANSLERLSWLSTGAATFTGQFTFTSGVSNSVATFSSAEPIVLIQASGVSNTSTLQFIAANSFASRIETNYTGGFFEFKTAGSIRLQINNTGTIQIPNLGGSGTQMVVTDNTGLLSTQAIPTSTFSGSLATGQVAFGTATNTIGGSNNLFWDNANGRLGIGTNTPSAIFHARISASAELIFKNTSQDNLYLSGSNATINIDSTGGGNFPGIFLKVAGTSYGQFTSNSSSTEIISFQTTPIIFKNSSAERARIFPTTGNFGINTGATDSGQRLQVNGTGYFSDSVGIGSGSLTSYGLRVGKTIVGATSSTGIYQDGTVQSTVTSNAFGIYNSARTQAAAFTLGNYYHFYADQFSLGASSAITNQYGYFADSTLTGATNNYGFFGNIAAGTGRWNLYLQGTANNYLAGGLAVGHNTLPSAAWTSYIITGSSGTNKIILGYLGSATNGATIGSVNSATSSWADTNIAGNNVIFRGGGETEGMRLTSARNLAIGSSADTGERLQITGTQINTDTRTYSSGAIQSTRQVKNLTFNSGATISSASTLSNYVTTGDNVFGGSVTIPDSSPFANIYAANYYQFSAGSVTVTSTQASGARRSVTQLWAQNYFKGTNSGTLTHVSSIQIPGYYNANSGTITPVITNAYQLLINPIEEYAHTFTFTNKWGIYQEGANDKNYFAGKMMLNTTTDTGQQLQINGSVRIDGQTSGTAGGSSGQHLIINCDGTTYKIALLNN